MYGLHMITCVLLFISKINCCYSMNMKQDNGLTAEATWFDKVWNAAEDLFESSAVKVWSILNSNAISSAGGAGVVALGGAQWVETIFVSCSFIAELSISRLYT